MTASQKLGLINQIFFLLLVAFTTPVSSEDYRFKGEMNCIVKSQIISAIEEGKPKSFTRYEGVFEVGDSLRLDYERFRPKYEADEVYSGIILSLVDPKRDHIIGRWGFIQKLDQIRISREGVFGTSEHRKEEMFFEKDWIRSTGSHGAINMRRYYKDDWEAIFTIHSIHDKMAVQTATLDCRSGVGSVEDIIKSLIKVTGQSDQNKN